MAEPNHDFHLYRGGKILRRVLSHARYLEGCDTAEWRATADGQPTRYEPKGLYEGTSAETLLDAARLEAILVRLGLPSAYIFGPGATRDAVLLSQRPGGAPLAA